MFPDPHDIDLDALFRAMEAQMRALEHAFDAPTDGPQAGLPEGVRVRRYGWSIHTGPDGETVFRRFGAPRFADPGFPWHPQPLGPAGPPDGPEEIRRAAVTAPATPGGPTVEHDPEAGLVRVVASLPESDVGRLHVEVAGDRLHLETPTHRFEVLLPVAVAEEPALRSLKDGVLELVLVARES